MTKQQVKEYCDAEFENINHVSNQLQELRENTDRQYTIVELAAMATFLHNFYNGIENIQKRILNYINVETKDTPTWHKDLLKISVENSIITEKIYDVLSGYLSFRHFFIHAYTFNLKWEDLKLLVDGVGDTLKQFHHLVDKYIEELK